MYFPNRKGKNKTGRCIHEEKNHNKLADNWLRNRGFRPGKPLSP
jgi:rubrerythrin